MHRFLRLFAPNPAWLASPDIRTRPFEWAALLILPVLLGILHVAGSVFGDVMPDRTYLTGDSPSYIMFDTERPIGYPVFIWIVETIFGNYVAVLYTQLAVFCLSVAVLGHAMFRLTGSLALALVLELMVVGHPGPIGLYNQIMSDSLATAVAALFMAAAIHTLRTQSVGAFVALCATLAAAIMIRPVSIIFVIPALAVAWLSADGQFRKILTRGAVVAATMALAMVTTPVAHLVIHGTADSSSPLARGLITKVMFDRDVVSSQTEACDAPFINAQIAPVLDHIEGAPSETTAWLLKRRYANYLRFRVIIPGLMERHGFEIPHQTDPILFCYTLDAARRFPLAVAAGFWEEYWTLLGNATFITAAEKAEFDAYVAANPPAPPQRYPESEYSASMRQAMLDAGIDAEVIEASLTETEYRFVAPPARPFILIFGLKFLQYGAWLLSGAAIMAILFDRIRQSAYGLPIAIIAVAGLVYHATLGATAAAGMAVPRFVFVVWPQIATIWIVAAALVMDWVLNSGRSMAGFRSLIARKSQSPLRRGT